MEAADRDKVILKLTTELSVLDAQFDAAARRRGFDPSQAENIALPTALARLFTEREAIKAELEDVIAYKKEEHY